MGLSAHIRCDDLPVLLKLLGRTLDGDAAQLQDISVVGVLQGNVDVLFDDQQRHALIGIDLLEDAEDVGDDQGGEPEGRLVQQQHPGPGHEAAGDGQHLLFAAAQGAAKLLGALLEDGEEVQDHFLVLGDSHLVAAAVGAHAKVLADAEVLEDFAPFGHRGDSQPDNFAGAQ